MLKRKSNWILITILLLALFLRVYKINSLLGFYYDQGRDALVVWDLWQQGKLFLIGPTTGLEGIFLGPFFYYLIAPFYIIGQGNPVWPAIFLAALSTLAIYVVYYIGWKAHKRVTGVFAAFISSFSYSLILAGRWLSNPTPILLTSILLLFSMWKIMILKKSSKWWVLSSFLIGLSLHFEAASAVFYIPMFIYFIVWQRKNLPNIKHIIFSVGAFLLTLMPQVIFNFRHNNILLNNFVNAFSSEGTISISFWEMLINKFQFFWEVYYTKIIINQPLLVFTFSLISLWFLIKSKKKVTKVTSLLIVYIGIPLIGYILFQGNKGVLYDYYMSGYYLPLVLLFSIGMGELWGHRFGKIIVLLFFSVFMAQNYRLLNNYFHARDGETSIVLENQLKAINWIFKDGDNGKEFNVDVYVPPVIPHAYDYLLLWQGNSQCGESLCGLVKEKEVPVLYTLYEEDPPHPERLKAWLDRQKGIGGMEDEITFGEITVQRRRRYK